MKIAVLSCLLVAAAPALAEPELGVGAHARIGSITAPFYTSAHPIVRSELQAYSLILDGWYRVRPQWSVGARVPIATSSVEEPAGSYVADYTLGNPLAFVEYDRSLRATTIGRARASLGAPLAGSGDAPSLVRNRVIAASSALEGWRSTELYQPGTVPLVISAALDEVRSAWRARATVKLAAFARIDDAGLPPDVRTHSLGIVPSVEIELDWHARRWLSVGLGAHAVVLALPPIEPMRDAGRSGRAQLALAPKLAFARGRASFTLDLLVAVAGPLDGIGLGAGIAWQK